MDERILARPEKKTSDTRRGHLDKLRLHLIEVQKLIEHWSLGGWNSKQQQQQYRTYENELIADIERLDLELTRGTRT